MKTPASTLAALRQSMPERASSIRYDGVKEARIPLPVLVALFAAIAAALFAAKRLLGA